MSLSLGIWWCILQNKETRSAYFLLRIT